MGVLLQGFFKLPPNNAVPSPADGNGAISWWWDHLASQANAFRQAGFTAVWLPPVLKTSSGANVGSDGYGPFDDYDIGSRNQKGSSPTRFGSREQLQRCAAIMRANGLDIYLDMVEHQRSGDTNPPFQFRYPGADGTPDIGRFPKNAENFLPAVPRDPNLGGPASDDVAFGRELAPINAKPPRYVFENLIAASDWLTRALDVQGYRVDDVKGLSTDFLLPFLNGKSMEGKFAVGEFFDGNRVLVNGWIFNPTGMRGRPSAFDFPLKFVLNAMCNNPGRFNMADLDHVGLAGISPANAVTFVENHDTDLSASQRIIFNKLLGYAYILTTEGYPCVYYRDYSTDKNCFGLKPQIDNLIWIHENLANGDTQQRFKDFNAFAYERMGGPHLLVGLNNDPGNARTINIFTGFGANVSLHDYSGHGGDVVTDGNGAVTITIPRNDNGLGYVCYSRQGITAAFTATAKPVQQDFEGGADLDILPAINGKTVNVCRIWCAANSPIEASLAPDKAKWTGTTTIKLELLDPDQNIITSGDVTLNSPARLTVRAVATKDGFYTFTLQAVGLPGADNPYLLSVSYRATQTLQTAVGPVSAAQAVGAQSADIVGEWSELITFKNVPIHTHVLPTGKILFWGRRLEADVRSDVYATLNVHQSVTYLWDPVNSQNSAPVITKQQPALADGTTVNLFCSGHVFLPDGRLLAIGGHLFDSQGVNQACIYDAQNDTWTATATMNEGRWYPTALTLTDGSVLAVSGQFPTGPLRQPPNKSDINRIQQVWDDGAWTSIQNFVGLPLFPRLHVAPDGRVFMPGGLAQSFFLDVQNTRNWVPGPTRAAANRDYAPSVMYDEGKIVFIGGGSDAQANDLGVGPPTNIVEIIDLNSANPTWQQTTSMKFPRRQHNATILADGTVFVTGGTQGAGSKEYTVFNDLSDGAPVHQAELWNPVDGSWTVMATESVDRCYHSTAVLLHDGRVFSCGGGEYDPDNNGKANLPKDSHPDGQIFSPPYLFKGPRPKISTAPDSVKYGIAFDVQTPDADDIVKITWIRLSSVTHSFNQNQRLNFLKFSVSANGLTVTPPANSNACPPGHYMLFLLNGKGVPSVAKIVQITPPVGAARKVQRIVGLAMAAPTAQVFPKRRPVVVGVTATCPYGISACWGGAYHALNALHGVQIVKDTPDANNSTADVYLQHDGLPDVDMWPEQFARVANGTHQIRGVEVTLTGSVKRQSGHLLLAGTEVRPTVELMPIQPANKVQWDQMKGQRKPIDTAEANAFGKLAQQVDAAGGSLNATITGPLIKTQRGFVLQVRVF